MAVSKDQLSSDKPPYSAHVEVITENGFTIARVCELRLSQHDSAGECHFIVSSTSGGIRSIKVEFSEGAIAVVQANHRTLSRTSGFWLQCAERHLTKYLWDNDGCPPHGLLEIDSLSAEELQMATRWE